MAADPTTTMDDLVACVCAALESIDRPVCECGLTVGPPEPGPTGCCQCVEGGVGGQASAFLERLYPVDNGTTFDQVLRLENCRPGMVAADITIVVIRCYPAMDEQGNMPTLEETTLAAQELNTDMVAVWNALKCCGENIGIRESAVDADPEGGCSAFAIRVTTLVSLPANPVPDVS